MNVLPLIAIALGVVFAGCDSDDGEKDPLADKTRAFITYNIGLATGYVDYAEERRPQLVTMINGFDADVICLQEAWTQGDVDAVVAGVSATFPYAHYEMLEDKTSGPPACNATESDPLLACIDEQCAGVASSEIAGCVLEKCRAPFDALSDSCTSCLVANIGKEVADVIAVCQSGSPKYTYDGANGLLVLSRAKINDAQHVKIESSLVQRSVLGVTVELPELGSVAVACTHIAADLSSSGVPYSGTFGSFEGENKAQAEVVRDFLADYGADADLRVALGDINSGPAFAPDVAEQIPNAGFKVFADAGYIDFPSSIADGAGKQCTYCAENTLNADTIASVQIDHIFLSSLPDDHVPAVARIGTELITVTLEDGSSAQTNPSDHFGVRLSFGH